MYHHCGGKKANDSENDVSEFQQISNNWIWILMNCFFFLPFLFWVFFSFLIFLKKIKEKSMVDRTNQREHFGSSEGFQVVGKIPNRHVVYTWCWIEIAQLARALTSTLMSKYQFDLMSYMSQLLTKMLLSKSHQYFVGNSPKIFANPLNSQNILEVIYIFLRS